jgi:hypothetical protein
VSMDPLLHTLTLEAGEIGSFPLSVGLPDSAGSFAVAATLTAEGQLLDSHTLVLAVERSGGEISDDLVVALQALAVGPGEAPARNHAISSVLSAEGRADPADAIADVLDAISRVRSITGVDVRAIRIDLARLLRVYQMRWTP